VIAGMKPDVLGWVGERPVVGEAELGPALASEHTRSQLSSFVRWRGPTGLPAVLALAVPRFWASRARSAALSAGADPSRLVIVSPEVRLQRRAAVATRPPLMQRGRHARVPPPGTLFHRGRETTRPVTQLELNEAARRLALGLAGAPNRF